MRRQYNIFAAALIGLAAALSAGRLAADLRGSDSRRLQGAWTLAYAQTGGAQLSGSAGTGMGLSVRGNLYSIGPNSASAAAGQFSVNPGRYPRQINLTLMSGPQAGQTYRGIYEINGDVQRVCFASPGQPRPTSFTPLSGSGQTLYVWQRPRQIAPRPRSSDLPTYDDIDYTAMPPQR
jgi:uncharacterized protein (TIGR03067 family)